LLAILHINVACWEAKEPNEANSEEYHGFGAHSMGRAVVSSAGWYHGLSDGSESDIYIYIFFASWRRKSKLGGLQQ